MLPTQASVAPEQSPSAWQLPGTQAAFAQMYDGPASPAYAALHRPSSVLVTHGPHTLDVQSPFAACPASVPHTHAALVPTQARLPSNDGPSFGASALASLPPPSIEVASSLASGTGAATSSPASGAVASPLPPPSSVAVEESGRVPSSPASRVACNGVDPAPPHP